MKRKVIGGILLVLLASVLLLYLALPFFAKPIVSSRLDIQGLTLVDLEIGLPSARGVAIHRCIVEHEDIGRISFFDGRLNYGEPTDISIVFDRVEHQFSEANYDSKERISQAPQNVPLSSLLPHAVLDPLPGFTIAIDAIDSEPYRVSLQQLRLLKHGKGLSLKTDVVLRDTQLPQQLSVDISTDNTLEFGVTNEGGSEPWLFFDARIDALDETLEGQIKAKTTLHKDFLAQLLALELPAEEGQFDLDVSFSLPDHAVSSDSILDKLTLQGRSLISARLDERSRIDADIYSHLRVSERLHAELFAQPSEVAYFTAEGEQEQRVMAAFSQPLKLSLDPYSQAWPYALVFENSLASTLVYNEEQALDFNISDIAFDEQQVRYTLTAKVAKDLIPDLGEGVSIVDRFVDVHFGLVSTHHSTQVAVTKPLSFGVEAAELREQGFSALKVTLPLQEFTVSHEQALPSDVQVKLSTTHEASQAGLNANAGVVFKPDVLALLVDTEPFDYNDTLFPGVKLDASISGYRSSSPELVFSASNACGVVMAQGKAAVFHDKQMLNLVAQQVFSESNTLQHWLNIDDLPMNLTAGRLNLELNAVFSDEPLNYDLDLKLHDAALVNDLGIFEGIQFLFSSITLPSQTHTRAVARPSQIGKVKLNIAKANLGVMLENFVLTGDLSEQGGDYYFDLGEGVVSAFGGKIKLQAEQIKVDNAIPFDVVVENMDLARIVETQQVDGLTTTGMLSGRLPLEYKDGNIVLRDGKLQSQQGGLIQYASPLKDSTDLNEQLKLTLDVLENFNYEILNTEVNYSDGTLMLNSKISGQNPDVAGGQRADLNLNTEVALDSSIQVMRLQSGLSSQLQKIVERNVNSGSFSNICQSGQ